MTETAESVALPPKKAKIYDLGYSRYAGERRPPSALWRVIARHQIKQAWKSWRHWRLIVVLPMMTTVAIGFVMYLSQNEVFKAVRANGAAVRFLDGLVPMSYVGYRLGAFFLTLTIASIGIARDRETGAFGFYFSRPVRPRDYVLGKLVGVAAVMASSLLVGPLLLSIFRICLSEDTSEVLRLLPWLGRVMVIGVLGSIVYAAAPMAISALIGKRWIALGAWVGYWGIALAMIATVASLTWKPLLAIDPGIAIDNLALRLWGLEGTGQAAGVSMTACIVSLCAHIGVSVSLLYWSVARHSGASVGASS